MDDASTFVPDRTGNALHLDRNNETTVSGLTEASYETPSVASYSSGDDRHAFTSSLPPSRFRGGTASRLGFSSGSSVASWGGRSRSSAFGGGGFDPIAEEGEESGSVVSGGGGGGSFPRHRTTAAGDDNSIWMGSENASVYDGGRERRGGGRGFDAGGLGLGGGFRDGGASVVSEQRSTVGLGLGGGFRDGSVSVVSEQRSAVGMGPYPSSQSLRGGAPGPGAPASTFAMGDDSSVVSGISHQRSVASQFFHSAAPPGSVAGRRRVPSGGASVASAGGQSVGSQRDRPSAPFRRPSPSGGGGNSVASSGHRSIHSVPHGASSVGGGSALGGNVPAVQELEEDPQEITQNVMLSAYDNTRHSHHNPKDSSVGEVDVGNYQEVIEESDEYAPLPEEYVLDENGRRYHPKKEEEGFDLDMSARKRRDEFEMLPVQGGVEPHTSPFSKKRRLHSMVTIMAATLLALVGLVLSVRSLSPPGGYDGRSSSKAMYGRDNGNGGYLYLPGYQFGGGVGGLVGGRELERRIQLAYGGGGGPYYGANLGGGGGPLTSEAPASNYAPAGGHPLPEVGDNGSGGGSYQGGRHQFQGGRVVGIPSHQSGVRDPFGGYGPPQMNPLRGLPKEVPPTLTSIPLTTYSPPPNADGSIVVLDPDFNGSFMDLAVLPYNPALELPVVLDVGLSGGSATKMIIGACLRMVQCTERGSYIFARERKAWEEGSGSPLDEEAASDASKFFNPPLRTEVVHLSTFINVDCTTSAGVDRGIAKELVTSDMVDVIYSPNIHDVGRLFAPPLQAYGRAVVVLRHPLERAVAKYKWMRTIDKDVLGMTLEEFARSDYLEDNILTRAIASKTTEDTILGVRELTLAKDILKRKFVVGLFDRMEDSQRRFEIFFRWGLGDDARACRHKEIGITMAKHYNNVQLPAGDSAALVALVAKNGLDMKLYEYSKFLYDYQGRTLFGMSAESVL